MLAVRLATASDLPSINAIYNHYVLTSTTTYQEVPSTPEERRAWFERRDPRHVVTVATLDGEVVGWASLNAFRERSAYRFCTENSVYVRHDLHRRGIGATLLADQIERARVNGFRTILAGIDGEQAASVALHEQFGFKTVAHLKEVGYKFDRWLDVLFMQLMLHPAALPKSSGGETPSR